jgi:two-component system response regulator HydG
VKRNPPKDVLIVDDDDSLRSMMDAALTRVGLTCDTAADGIHALEHLGATPYSIVLLDLVMPRLDGAGVLQELRLLPLPAAERPIVVMITASTEREALVTLGDLVQVVIRKPVDLPDLTGLVRDCVSARAQRSAGHGGSHPEAGPRA